MIKNCKNCGVVNECEAYLALKEISRYFPESLVDEIENIVYQTYNCEYWEEEK